MVCGLLLFATSGVALSRMTCLLSGRTVMIVGMLEDCCPDVPRNEGAVVTPVCCDLSAAEGANVIGLRTVPVELDGSVADLFWSIRPLVVLSEGHSWQLRVENRPPPLHTAERLAVLERYLI